MAAPVLQFKRGAFADLPALKAGEPGFTTDKYDFYIGLDNNSGNNKFFGSHRYWTKETTTAGSAVNIVEGTNNGVHAISIKSPASLAGSYDIVFPNAQGGNTAVLQNDGSGNLSWDTSPTFAGAVTVSDTTQSTSKDTGALIVEGGVGIEKDVHVGGATSITGRLYVEGQSEFIGVATFRGGTVRLGDSASDDIYVGGEFKSNLVPDDDDTYDLGTSSQEWRNIYIDGTANLDTVAAGTAAVADLTDNRVVIAGSSGELEDDSNLTFDGTTFTVGTAATVTGPALFSKQVSVSGVSTFIGNVDADGNIDVAGNAVLNGDVDLGNATGDTITATGRFDSDLTPSTDNARDLGASGLEWKDLYIDGTANIDTLSADAATLATAIVSDLTDNRVVIAGTSGELEDSANLTFDGSTLALTGALTVSTNATITGNLTVLGTQSILNTETLKVEDSLIEVGLVNSGGSLVPPSSDGNIDVGVIMHYYSGSAKKAAVYWDDSVSRVVVGSDVSESTSVLTAAAYAALEVGSLWIKDAAGQTETIGHDGSQRILHNITVDGGSF